MNDPNTLLANDRPPSFPLAGSLKLFDINILPERYRRRKVRLIGVVPWLAFIVLLLALYPSILVAMQAQVDFSLARERVASLQATIENTQTNADEFDRITAEIQAQSARRDQILASYEGLELAGSSWSTTLLDIIASTPDGIQYTQITQQEGLIYLDGIADSYSAVLDLSDSLQEIKDFHSVQINSIEEILPEDTAAPLDAPEEDGQPGSIPKPSFTFTLAAVLFEEGVQ